MNIKNISQITEDTFSKLFHPIKSRYKVTVDTFSKLFLPITSRISEHRLAIRSLLNSKQSSENRSENRLTKLLALNSPKSSTISYKPLNFITIASILPFFLGFYDFINQNKQLKQLLFEKNIPAFSIPTESLNWDTFQYFNETKKDFLLGLEKVEWSTNSLFLTKKTNTQVFDQEYLIASFNNTIDKQSQSSFLLESDGLVDKSKADFKNPVFETGLIFDKDNANDNNLSLLSVNMQNFGSNRFYLYSLNKQPAVSFLQTFYLHLDEVPLKLDNLISYYTFSPLENKIVLNSDQQNSLTKLLPFHKNFWIEETKGIDFFSYQNSYFEKQTEKINSSDLLFQSEGFSKNEIPALSQFNTSKNPSEVDSKFFMKKQTSWFLQKIQYKTQNSIGSSFFQITPKNNFQRNDINNLESLNNLEELILELEKVLQEQDFSSLRRMSGYSYPDMNSKQVESFLIHNFFSYFPKNLGLSETTENSLKIIFPANPAFIKQYYFSNPKIPTKLSIKTGLVNFKDLDHKETLYNSVAVFLDSKNGLDWQLKESPFREGTPNMENESTSANSRSTHESVQNYRFFLENYFSPVNPLTHSALTYIKNDLKKIAFNSRTIFFSRDDIIIPFLTENEWKETYNQNKTASVLPSDYTVNGISLPINKITLPASKYNYARLNYTLNSTLDYRYSPQINTINPLSSSSSKLTPLILKGEFFTENFSPVNYKKLLSIFNQPNFLEISLFNKSAFIEKSFSDNWEPLSFGSWLLVSQIGIAYLFFNFIKSIISDYFNELIGFILDFGSALGIFDENIKQEIELATGQRDKGYRVLSDPKKKFQDIAGINTLLPEIAEIVWFLRNSGKEFAESKNIPRGLLLLGPPGTGKTALVQALAGEAKVPIVTLSGSSLIAPGESGALKLEILFQEARQLAPCIVFIDEIDSLAQKREGVMLNPMGGDEILSVLEPVNSSLDFGQLTSPDLSSQTSFFNKMESSLPTSSLQIQEDLNSSSSNKLALDIKQQMHAQEKYQHQQLTLLMQLLIELDGLQGRKGVIVVGATNRPELLDPAILRPGRFDKILELGLPSYKKRLEIMKLYGKIVSYDPNISWEYLSKRTVGYTAADLTSIMNQSSLKVIYNNKKIQHTLETIEHGIDRITTSNVEKPNRKIAPILVNRVAYYQAGKILLSTILEHHPPTLVSYLWQRRQNRRSIQILTNLQKYFFQFARRCELEHRIVGCYGGKAAEILFLLNSPVSVSTFGLEDLTFGFVLICFTIEKWYIYSKSTLLNQLTQIISNKNSKELIPEKIEIFKELASSMELSPYLLYSHEMDVSSYPFSQNFFSSAWWQLHISQQLEFVERHFADWYRLYLPNPEETELNIEWSPPDEFYHRNLLNKQINKNSSITWNDLHNIARDYQVHGFVLQSFNKALSIIDENREFLDKLVVELLKREVLRQTEIEKLASRFLPVKTMQESSTQNLPPIRIVNNSFGQMSRRKIKNWIDFKDFEN